MEAIKTGIARFVGNGNIGDLLPFFGKIKWSNKYDCPVGYEYNADGYVETKENYIQVSVNMMPRLLNEMGEYHLLYQNAIALMVLNPDKGIDRVGIALKYKFNSSIGRFPNNTVLESALSDAYSTKSLGSVLHKMNKSIFSFYSVWYKKGCDIGGRAQIRGVIRNEVINRTRSFMPVNTKFKTACVMKSTEESEYAVNIYWKENDLDKQARIKQAVVEAIEELASDGVESTTIKEIGQVAGLSRNTVSRVLRNKD